jgi:ABC-type molybdenum transport system ATPase subunit/photorepair protein PhrA
MVAGMAAAKKPTKRKSAGASTRLVVEVTGLSVERDGTTILDGVEWRVRRGQNWVILGANGSGKTSLLKSLAGYLMPSSGDVSVLGERFGESDWRELRKHIGLVSSSIGQKIPEQPRDLTDRWGQRSISANLIMIEVSGRGSSLILRLFTPRTLIDD